MGIIPEGNLVINFLVIALSFLVLIKSANFLVDGSVGIAAILKIPKLIIGIVLVSFATTAPEFTVSMISALEGYPEIALGNAVGSVIADNALAMALGIIVAPTAIAVYPRTLKIYGTFLLAVGILAFILVFDGIFTRLEGIILLFLLAGYIVFIYFDQRKQNRSSDGIAVEIEEHTKSGTFPIQFLRFLAGLGGVILASRFLVDSAVNVAKLFKVSEAVIGLTIVAIGTSLPEIATCIVASLKKHGDLAFGDILGANLLNILWILGAAATANPISASERVILFSFPSMLFFIIILLFFAGTDQRFDKWEGVVLLCFYILYSFFAVRLLYLAA